MEKIKKCLYILGGFIAVALGAIGVILPILPTTPFLLLALFCFSKGSKRWNDWFIQTQLYKKYLHDYVQRRAMTLRQKISILLFADFMIAFPLVIINNWLVRILLIAVILTKYYYFIFKIKTIEPPKDIKGNLGKGSLLLIIIFITSSNYYLIRISYMKMVINIKIPI